MIRKPHKENKYHNRRVRRYVPTVGFEEFDSVREADRYGQLRLLEKAGKISQLERQVKFELLPNQRDENGRIVERAVTYIADFVYIRDGEYIVEDAKGVRTDVYRLKKKMLLYFRGLRITET